MAKRTNKICGIYIINGPAGVYVGQSKDCYGRESLILATKLGLDWGIVRELPCSMSYQERVSTEMEVAQQWEDRGFVVVSRNTHKALSKSQKQKVLTWKESFAQTIAKRSPERRKEIGDRISAAKKNPSAKTRARISAASKRRMTPEYRKRLSRAHRGKRIPLETRKKIAEAVRVSWDKRRRNVA